MVITIVVVVLVVLVAAGIAGYLLERRRTQQLQDRFGPEYDRAVNEVGSRRRAARELASREKRHEQLDIRPLSSERVQAYRLEWESTQARFVDEPDRAVTDADGLVEALMSERGYPIGDFDTQVADLSVQHADVLQHYRAAHAIATAMQSDDAASDTETMRRAMVHYRALFTALLDDGIDLNQEERAHTNGRTR